MAAGSRGGGQLVAEIGVVPFPGDPALGSLFVSGAEGSYAWFETLAHTTLAPGEEAVMVVARDGRAPVAALPMVRAGKAMRALTAPYTTRYAPALATPEWARLLGRRAREYVPGVLRLDAVDPADPGLAAFLEGLDASGLVAARYGHFVNWYEPLTDFDSYWQRRPSRLRATARRKLARIAGAAFRCYRDGFGEAIAAYEDIYRSSWKSPEPHPAFIPAMVRALGYEGFVRLGVMRLAERPVAAQIWLMSHGRATIFKLAHREDMAGHSPGTLLTRWMAETLMREEGLLEIDFGRGDDAYKRDWLGRSRRRIGVVAGDWRTRAGLSAVLRDVMPTRLAAAARRGFRHGNVSDADNRGLIAASCSLCQCEDGCAGGRITA